VQNLVLLSRCERFWSLSAGLSGKRERGGWVEGYIACAIHVFVFHIEYPMFNNIENIQLFQSWSDLTD
jgi:hypothetical protein